MRYLVPSDEGEIIVKPRWPYARVAVSESVYRRLQEAQTRLSPHALRLVLTRGHEYEGPVFRRLHRAARALSAALFHAVYPERGRECKEIFSANGHDAGGDSVDIGIVREGKRLKLLSHGVFTPKKTIIRSRELHHRALALVRDALELNGFVIHTNDTEALQIHCRLAE